MEKIFEFRIEEHTTYWQRGTVTVVASSLEDAKEKCIKGEYEHSGDNEILWDTEGPCLEREIVDDDEKRDKDFAL